MVVVSVILTEFVKMPPFGMVVGIAAVPGGVISMVNDAEDIVLGMKVSL